MRKGKGGGAGEIVSALKAAANPENVKGMARFGINPRGTLGVGIPALRAMAKKTGRDQALSLALWKSGIHEARILAALVGEPEKVGPAQMDRWVRDFDSWDVCDQVCGNLFDRTPHAWEKAAEWSLRKNEFEKRAGFVLMATLAVHDRQSPDNRFLAFLPMIEEGASDGRNFVKKAVNWALRQIGKRSGRLRKEAMRCAEKTLKTESPSARWVARDALRELKKRVPAL